MRKELMICTIAILFSSLSGTGILKAQNTQAIADSNILAMKEGVLLVRLVRHTAKIEQLKKMKQKDQAKKIEKDDAKKNEKVMEAFAEHFDFCPVYFFYSDYSIEVKNKDFGNHIMTADNNPVDAEKIASGPIYTAEYGFIRNDTGTERARGIRIMDDQLDQLSHPFPYGIIADYVLWKRSESSLVRSINGRLHNFYNGAANRKLKSEFKQKLKNQKS